MGLASVGLGLLIALVSWFAVYRGRLPLSPFHAIIATLLAIVAAFAQLVEGAGPGAWSTVLAVWLGIMTIFLALFRGQPDFSRWQAGALVLALIALPLWYLSGNAATAALLACLGEVALYGHVLRQRNVVHWSGVAVLQCLGSLRWLCSFMAIDRMSVTTAAYPLTLAGLCGIALVQQLFIRKNPR